MPIRFLAAVAATILAGCAPSTPAVLIDGPTSADLPTAPLAVEYDLPPVARPRLPAALRAGPAPATEMPMDHAAMGHAMPDASRSDADGQTSADHDAMGHGGTAPDLTLTALTPVVDAYLALHAALVGDDLSAGRVAAGALAASVVQGGLGSKIQPYALAAEAATDLDGLRTAFGDLGPPMVALVEAVGAPPGRDLSAFRCGMADAPGGGVWMQATPDLANPLLAGMKTCGRHTGAVGVTDPGEMSHETMDHGADEHEGMQHD